VRSSASRSILWLLLASLCGCEQVAKLDDLYIDEQLDERDTRPDPHTALRELCIATINKHRASLNLAPLSRASRQQEGCSDEGAEEDREMNMPHYAAQHRSARCDEVGFGPQNACPDWRFGPGSDYASAADALVACIDRMWSQGEPPGDVDACKADLAAGGCYEQYGERINLTNARAKYVACGVSLDDGSIWVNQDFSSVR
jgi:hypothetical protein